MPMTLLDRALAMCGLCRHRRLDACHAAADRLAIAERHANIAQMRNRAILRALPDLLFIHSAEGRFLDYYARDRRQLLLPPERVLGRSIDEVLPPDLAASFGSMFRQAASADGPIVHHYSLELHGAVRHYEARVVRCDDGTFLSIVRDQSAQRDAELQLAVAHREASNLFSGRSNQPAPVAINDIIRAAYSMAGVHLEHVRATVRFELAQNLPAVVGDRLQLQQVVLQLMMNAADALSDVPATSPRLLSVSSRAHDASVSVSIADIGAGVDESLVERLLEPLFTTRPDAVGMGLTASRSIIDAHGGSLWATRNRSSGAVFTFSLPTSAP